MAQAHARAPRQPTNDPTTVTVANLHGLLVCSPQLLVVLLLCVHLDLERVELQQLRALLLVVLAALGHARLVKLTKDPLPPAMAPRRSLNRDL
jgi:hypothetical protein